MTRRSPLAVAALAVAASLLSGPAVAGCDSPVNANDGTTSNDPADRSGDDPTGVSQGNVPVESDGAEGRGDD